MARGGVPVRGRGGDKIITDINVGHASTNRGQGSALADVVQQFYCNGSSQLVSSRTAST